MYVYLSVIMFRIKFRVPSDCFELDGAGDFDLVRQIIFRHGKYSVIEINQSCVSHADAVTVIDEPK